MWYKRLTDCILVVEGQGDSFGLMNMMSSGDLEAMSSNLVQIFIWARRWAHYILVVEDQRSRSLWPHKPFFASWTRYQEDQENATRGFFQIRNKYFTLLRPTDKLIRFVWSELKVTVVSINMFSSFQHDISSLHFGNFFKFLTCFYKNAKTFGSQVHFCQGLIWQTF